MLEIIIPEQHYELYDEKREEFLPKIDIKETTIQLEHSLLSLKKWEQTWHKPFLSKEDKTYDEILDYIRCMTLTHNVDPKIYHWIPDNVINEVLEYIKDPMTATWFSDNSAIDAKRNTREVITSEIIYYWMIELNIPVEFQKWHLNQLLTLIKVINIKHGDPKKVDKQTAARERARLNKIRREQLKSKG